MVYMLIFLLRKCATHIFSAKITELDTILTRAVNILTTNELVKLTMLCSVISKGPKYRFPSHTDFNKCWETITSALNDYCMRWCKREHVDALNNWKLKSFKIIDERVLFYSMNLDLLPPKPKLSFRYLKHGIQESRRKYVVAPADKANNVVILWRLHYINTLIQELGSTKTYKQISTDERSIVNAHSRKILLSLQWVLKKNKTDFLRYIGYRNFINDLIKHVSLLILGLFCPNC